MVIGVTTQGVQCPFGNIKLQAVPEMGPAAAGFGISSFHKQMIMPAEVLAVSRAFEPRLIDQAEIYDAAFFNENNFLDRSHQAQIDLDDILQDLLAKVGLKADAVRVHVYDERGINTNNDDIFISNSEIAKASINPVTGNMFISRAMLDVLANDKALIRSVMAHEIGHYVFRHHCELDEKGRFDPLGSHVGGFEEEYSCDRFATFLSVLSGDDPKSIGMALAKIEDHYEDLAERLRRSNEHHTGGLGEDELKEACLSLFQTHPYASRRIRANTSLARQLKANENPVELIAAVAPSDISSDFRGLAWRDTEGEFTSVREWNKPFFRHLNTCADPILAIKLASFEVYTSYHFRTDDKDTVIREFPQAFEIDTEGLGNKLLVKEDYVRSLEDVEQFDELLMKMEEKVPHSFYETDVFDEGILKKDCVESLNELGRKPDDSELQSFVAQWFQAASIAISKEGFAEGLENFQMQIEEMELPDIKLLLELQNPRDLLSASESLSDLKSLSGLDAASFLQHHAVTRMMLDSWIDKAREAGQDDMQILEALFETSHNARKRHGMTCLSQSTAFLDHLISCFEDGDTAQRKKIVELLDSNPNAYSELADLSISLDYTDYRDFHLPAQILGFARNENIELKNLRFDPVAKIDKVITAASPLREIVLIRVPEIKLILECKESGKPEIRRENNPFSPLDTIRFKFSDKITDEQLAKLKVEILECLSEHGQAEMDADSGQLKVIEPLQRGFDSRFNRVRGDAHALLEKPLRTVAEIREFLPELSSDLTLTEKLVRLRSASANTIVNKAMSQWADDYILIHGEDAYVREYLGLDRHKFDATGYADLEEHIFTYKQIWNLWDRAFADEFNAMPAGAEKLDFLLYSQPLSLMSRDQKIIEAMGMSPVALFDDVQQVQKEIAEIDDLDTLFKLREGFYNMVLVQSAQERIYDLLADSAALAAESYRVEPQLASLNDKELAANTDLQRILLSFNTASYRRNEILLPFIESANNEADKNLLSSWLTEPAMVDFASKKSSSSTISEEGILDLVENARPLDKADFLLYLLGRRDFVSEDPEARVRKDTDLDDPISIGLGIKQGLYADKEYRFWDPVQYTRPDIMIRISKGLGISPDALLDLENATSSKRLRMDVLELTLNGETGIFQDEELKEGFIMRVADQLIDDSASIVAGQAEPMKEFIAHALKTCPPEKVSEVFLNLWDISKNQAGDLPSLVAGFLQSSGPAFIKFGQKLATMDIPGAYKEAFRDLSSENSVSDTALFYHHMDVAYGQDDTPFDYTASGAKLGEGSMATTYKAKLLAQSPADLKAGAEERAVKIIHPFVRPELDTDIAYIKELVDYINSRSRFDDFGGLRIPANTPEILRKQLLRQSDPEEEIKRAGWLADDLAADVKDGFVHVTAPVDHDLSRDNIIVTKLQMGCEVDKAKMDGLLGVDEANDLRNAVGLRVMRQILTGEVFQSDVNLGNFGLALDKDGEVIRRKGKPVVVWYDYGAVEQTSADDQKTLVNLILAFNKVGGKEKELAELLASLIEGDVDAELQGEIDAWLARPLDRNEGEGLEKIKNRFESFLDFVSSQGREISDRWVELANTIAMLNPLLAAKKEASDDEIVQHRDKVAAKVEDLVKLAVSQHLSMRERMSLSFSSLLA